MVQLHLLANMALAMLMGGFIGFEREAAGKSAGLRTHMLVAGSAALLTGLGEVLISEISIDNSVIRVDPIRIIEAIITGVSFLGAGSIIRNRGKNQIEGLTTAASLLLSAAIGIGIATNQYILTIGAVIIVLVTLRLIKFIEFRLQESDHLPDKTEEKE